MKESGKGSVSQIRVVFSFVYFCFENTFLKQLVGYFYKSYCYYDNGHWSYWFSLCLVRFSY